MPAAARNQRRRGARDSRLRIPGIGVRFHQPTRGSLAWYGTLTAMAALEVVEWPLALVSIGGHLVATNTDRQAVQGAAEAAEDAT